MATMPQLLSESRDRVAREQQLETQEARMEQLQAAWCDAENERVLLVWDEAEAERRRAHLMAREERSNCSKQRGTSRGDDGRWSDEAYSDSDSDREGEAHTTADAKQRDHGDVGHLSDEDNTSDEYSDSANDGACEADGGNDSEDAAANCSDTEPAGEADGDAAIPVSPRCAAAGPSTINLPCSDPWSCGVRRRGAKDERGTPKAGSMGCAWMPEELDKEAPRGKSGGRTTQSKSQRRRQYKQRRREGDRQREQLEAEAESEADAEPQTERECELLEKLRDQQRRRAQAEAERDRAAAGRRQERSRRKRDVRKSFADGKQTQRRDAADEKRQQRTRKVRQQRRVEGAARRHQKRTKRGRPEGEPLHSGQRKLQRRLEGRQ